MTADAGISNSIQIVALSDDLERHRQILSDAAALHRTLRPNLPPDYEAYMRQMFKEGAEMAALTLGGRVKSLAVYRCHHTTFHGLRFYLDDLVTDESERGRGYGKAMLGWCEARARERGCDVFDLESGVQRSLAHRFYFREKFTLFAFSFTKTLR